MKLKEVLANFKRVFVKRKYKDILFRYVFREKQEILQLYNAINHTNYTNPDDLMITTMEDAIYIGMKNDLSFLVANELNLYEHQSTLNKNMPLRGLFYIAKMYEGYIETHGLNKYQKTLIKLPFPRFVVFYNGEDNIPEELCMRLSDAFEKHEEEPAVECVARFININYGHNQELLNSCKRLHDYSYFVNCVRGYLKKGLGKKEAIVLATDKCIEEGILKDVLVKHRAEVVDMFLTTFDKKMYEEAVREEGREEERVNTERERANAERERANAERERQRAEKAEAELEKLREEMARLKGE
ncbi:MAG: hypothetical protein IJZ53_10000 [Tyzzerella sp.]|nr:hypothetical protein [Tyzzerella sp.]